MRLDVDLSFDASSSGDPCAPETQRLDMATIARLAYSPTRLWRQLRATHFTEVKVSEGELPLSAVQAACLLFVSAVPTQQFVVGDRSFGTAAFLWRALLKFAIAVPLELLRSATLARSVARSARQPVDLPVHISSARKVLYVRANPTLNWMGTQIGGAATHTQGVINGLVENGVEVDVLAPQQPVGTDRARFIPVHPRRVLQLVPGLGSADYAEQLVSNGRNLKADFVYQRHQNGSDVGLKLARRMRVPLVLEFNGSELWLERHWGQSRVRLGGPLLALERRNLLDASLVVVVSNALRDNVIAEGARPERVLVNPNGVDVEALSIYRERPAKEWRSQQGLSNAPTVGFIGTFGRWHGVNLLPAIAQAVPDASWIVIGDGPLFPEVQTEMAVRGLDDRVTLTGLVEHNRALELLSCCDVCVSPHVPNPDNTPFFGSPTKLFEYMGLGKAIVASDLGQIGEVLTHGQTGLLCAPGDVEAMAHSVNRLLDDEALRNRLGDSALALADSKYTWRAHVRRILDALAA
jgi:glycosyltransferase involved in cell wall biosynthesis